jgi:hypothetical protein
MSLVRAAEPVTSSDTQAVLFNKVSTSAGQVFVRTCAIQSVFTSITAHAALSGTTALAAHLLMFQVSLEN